MSEIAALLGRVVAGKFAIEEHVGGGAMGEVFRARHVVLDTAIALKIMRPDIAKDPMFKQRFYREAKAASRLDHANSVRVLDFGVEPDGLVYLAMEFLHGRDLLSVLREEWPLPDERIVDMLLQTLAAVAVAHDLGIVHRDLKPENIMVSIGHEEDGAKPYHVKVCDFGIAKLNDPRGFQTDGAKALTSSGTLIGTPEYMSPEQARGDPLDARSDLYSLGIVLYQLLVGRVPFSAENALGVVLKQVTDEPVPPSRVRPGVNPRLEAICMRALKKLREERYQTAKEMRRDLRGVFGYRPNTVTDESGAHLPAAAPLASDASSAATIVYSPDVQRSTEGGPTLHAPMASVKNDADFAAKHTSDGTELTVPVTSTHRYVGVFVAVAAAALLVGAASMIVIAKRGGAREEGDAGSVAAKVAGDDAAAATVAAGAGAGALPASVSSTEHGASAPPLAVVAANAPVTVKHGAGAGAKASASASASASAKASAPAASVASVATGGVVAADPNYNPAAAYVVLGNLENQRVRADVLQAKMSALLPKLSGCYRSALMMVGAPVGGSAEIHMSIDDKGNITAFVSTMKLPQFARCAQAELAGQKVPVSALESGSMGATATQWLTLHP
jgi:serine/threonine-protein kinase